MIPKFKRTNWTVLDIVSLEVDRMTPSGWAQPSASNNPRRNAARIFFGDRNTWFGIDLSLALGPDVSPMHSTKNSSTVLE